MPSFIDKFFGFVKIVKNIVAGRKKESQEPEVIHESELPNEPEIMPEPEHKPEEPETQEPEIQESEPQESEPQEPETQESEPQESEPQEHESEEPETQELKLNETEPEEQEAQEPEPQEPKPEEDPKTETKEPECETGTTSEVHVQEEEITHESELEPERETEITSELHEQEEEITYELEPESSESERKDEYDYTYISQKIRNIITQHYSYSGFSINDTSGYSRFRTYARDYELLLPESDSELRRLIVSSGTLIEGNVYVFSHEDVQRMLCEVQRLIDDGLSIIYYRDLESFIEDSNLYSELSNIRAVHEILRDNYEGCIFTELYMESSSGHEKFRSYMDGLKYILAKYFPDGFNSDYALLREYALKENIILSGNDKALKRETEALKEWLYDE